MAWKVGSGDHIYLPCFTTFEFEVGCVHFPVEHKAQILFDRKPSESCLANPCLKKVKKVCIKISVINLFAITTDDNFSLQKDKKVKISKVVKDGKIFQGLYYGTTISRWQIIKLTFEPVIPEGETMAVTAREGILDKIEQNK